MEAPVKARKQWKSTDGPKYRQIAREDHKDILGNNLEPVNFGAQAFSRFKIKKKRGKRSSAVEN